MKPNLYSIARNAHIAAALFAVVLALAGFANADSDHSQRGKKGSLKITVATEVGGVTLPPGDYEVREVNTPSGPVMEFVHEYFNLLASELVQANQEEVLARVKFTQRELSSPPKHTQLLLASNPADATGLEIRGNAVSYEFAPSQVAAKDKPEVVCTNSGEQE
jgi:hypothetical protein